MKTQHLRANVVRSVVFVGLHSTEVRTHTMLGTLLKPATPPRVERRLQPPLPPRASATFRDRMAEQNLMLDALAPGQIIWLHGPGGCGNSALLRQVASLPRAQTFADGVVYLAGETTPPGLQDVLHHLLVQFYENAELVKFAPQLARTYLRNVQALIILDGLHMDHADLEQLAALMSGCAFLIAEHRPAPAGITAVPLPGLPLEDALLLCTAVSQFSNPATQVKTMLERLSTRLDNLPLPVLLLASQIEGQMARLRLFVEKLEQSPGQQAPLLRAVSLLVAELSNDERAVLSAIVGAGGVDVAFDALMDISQRPPGIVSMVLKRLIAVGIVVSHQQRFALGSSSLRYAFEQALQPWQERRRAVTFFAAAILLHGTDPAWVEREYSNIQAAIQTALTHNEMKQVGVLTRGLQPYLVLSGLWDSWKQALDRAEEAARATGDRELFAWTLHERGTRAGLVDNEQHAREWLHEAQHIRQQLGDSEGAAASAANLLYLENLSTRVSPVGGYSSLRETLRQLSAAQWLVASLPLLLLLISLGIGLLFPDLLRQPLAVLGQPAATPTATTLAMAPTVSPTATATLAGVVQPATPTPSSTRQPSPTASTTATPLPAPTAYPVPTSAPGGGSPPPAQEDEVSPAPTLEPTATSLPAPLTATATATSVPPTTTEVPIAATATVAATITATPEPSPIPATATPDIVLAAPALDAPANDAELACEDDILLTWNSLDVPETVSIQYDWQLEQASTSLDEETDPVQYEELAAETTSDTSVDVTELIECARRYRWRVRASSPQLADPGPFAEERTFRIVAEATPTPTPSPTPDADAPEAPDLIDPRDEETFFCNDPVTLIWNAVDDPAGIDRYDWEVYQSTSGRTGSYRFAEAGSSVSTSVTLTSLECRDESTWYRWRVRAVDQAGNEGDYSDDWYFELVDD